MGPVKPSEKLRAFAQSNANRLKMVHTQGSGWGENIASQSSSEGFGSIKDMITNGVKMWYMELCQLGIVGGVCGFRTSPDLHMTQVLWKASKRVGCGLQLTKSYGMIKYVMFANYEPKG